VSSKERASLRAYLVKGKTVDHLEDFQLIAEGVEIWKESEAAA